MIGVLVALQQADAAFPSGSFAFSNGMEGLAALGQRFDRASLTGLFACVLRRRWAGCERVAVGRAWTHGPDPDALAPVDAAVEAATATAPLREGSRANGAALLAAHARIGTPGADGLHAALRAGTLHGHLPVMQGALWRAAGMGADEAVLVSGYTTVATLAAAAVRLGAVGALVAQQAVTAALPLIATLATQPADEDGALIAALPWLDIACARQAGAGLRLFAN